ncbi:hypothetical protein HK104_006275 [Borealophlyctis nickersoniae]|nr:hypothetical protein HK104_006275 [Borealophlyctis nickersoniae]
MLHAWWTANEHASIEAEPAFERPVFRVRDIEELNVFFDLVAKIVHIDLNTDNYEQLNLHVTDYTINDRLPAPEFEFDDSKFPIMDNMVFRCTLWDEHVINARHLNLTPGMYVFLRNVRSKWNDMTGDLEGAMHGDRVYTGRNGIFILDETHPDTEHIRTAEQMLRIQKMPPTSECLFVARHKVTTFTRHIAAIKDPTLVITSIKDVLAFPHVPYKFRVKAKVVDHRPQNIADFCKLCLEVDATKCETCHGTPKTYEFRFMLLLSDGTGYLRLIVTSSDELFNGLQPTNLRQNDQALTELKRILSRLWDTSVEKGEGFVKDGRNFDCCVKSYEVRKGDEKSLRYRVFDTLINS